jgi:hypothetical protein
MHRTDLIYRYPKLLAILNVLIALSLLIITLFFARDILSLLFKKAEKAVPHPPAGAQKVKKGLQEYEGLFRNNPFGFQGGQLRELSVAREGGVSHSDLTLIGSGAGHIDNHSPLPIFIRCIGGHGKGRLTGHVEGSNQIQALNDIVPSCKPEFAGVSYTLKASFVKPLYQ